MKVTRETKRLLYAFYFPGIFLFLLWSVKLFEMQFGWDLRAYGNYPRDVSRLYGILLQPVIHEDILHLWSNTLPLLILLWALFYFYGDIYFKVFGWIWIMSGILTWMIGRPAYHIGASGLVYGISFFLFFSGVIRQRRSLMALSAIVAFLYGGIVWNMFPIAEYIAPQTSWEGHLSGAISGTALAFWMRRLGPQREEPLPEEYPEDDDEDGNEYPDDEEVSRS